MGILRHSYGKGYTSSGGRDLAYDQTCNDTSMNSSLRIEYVCHDHGMGSIEQ